MIDQLVTRLPYVGGMVIIAVGLFVLVDDEHLVKKVIGLNLFQTGVFLVFITAGYRADSVPPITTQGGGPYANPLTQVLMLTAIVVGVSVTSVALTLVVRLHREYGTLREDVLEEVVTDE